MMITKSVKVVSSKFRHDFEKFLEGAIKEMENKEDVMTVDIQFSTSHASSNTNDVLFSALVIGKGIPA